MSFDGNVDAKPGLVTTFSGSDIKCVFGNIEVGNLQGISWSVNREVRPIFVCGEPNALSYSKNKRGVAGSMVLTVFDRGALFDIMNNYSQVYRTNQTFHPGLTETPGASGLSSFTEAGARKAYYADEIPPFNITLFGQNEFNKQMTMGVIDVTIISEGAGISIDDGIQEAQFTYVARHVLPWKPLKAINQADQTLENVFAGAFTPGTGDVVTPCTPEQVTDCATQGGDTCLPDIGQGCGCYDSTQTDGECTDGSV
jgi:hypothetical protein